MPSILLGTAPTAAASARTDEAGRVLQIWADLSDIPVEAAALNSTHPPVPSARDPKERTMIQLANDPNASRPSFRPAPTEGKGSELATQRGRSGHAWPFLSRQAIRPAQKDAPKPAASDSGS